MKGLEIFEEELWLQFYWVLRDFMCLNSVCIKARELDKCISQRIFKRLTHQVDKMFVDCNRPIW